MRTIYISLAFLIIASSSLKAQEDLYFPELDSNVKAKSIQNLSYEINSILNKKGLNKTNIGIAVYSLDEKKYYYQKNINKTFTPASVTKLFTTFSALYLLGSDYLIRTSVYLDGKIKDSTYTGNVYLYGRGDALFSVDDLKEVCQKIYEKGIRRIDGNIYADGSYFDEYTNRLDYSNDKDIVEPLPPITALTLERNTAKVVVDGKTDRTSPEVYTIPSSEALIISNLVRFSTLNYKESDFEKSNKSLSIPKYDIANIGDAPPAPRRRKSVRIIASRLNDGKQKFTVKGKVRKNQTLSYAYYFKNPMMVIAGAFKDYLVRTGIEVIGDFSGAETPNEILIKGDFVNFKRPIAEIIYKTNKDSDNYLAENLFKIIGAYSGAHDNNSPKTRLIQSIIFDAVGVECDKCKLNDGSGLSRRNLITPKAVIDLLVKSQYLPFDELLYNSLPIGCIDGTLDKRMINTVAEYNVSAKTGTLRNVSSLSGFLSTMDGEMLVFSLHFNGPDVYNYKVAEDEICILLSSFFYSE